jgi:colicin import membrane protein
VQKAMHEHADRLDFAPPPQTATLHALIIAIIAHILLLLALTWGVHWKRESENVAAEAELWSSVPEQAAPKVVQAPPLPAPVPVPVPPAPPAPKVVVPPPPPAPARQPDINLEREKRKQELAERKREELELKKKLEARQKLEELEREKKLEARKKQEELKRQEVLAQKAAEEKKKKAEELAKAKAKQDDAKLAALRKENMDRMMKGAAGSGAPTSEGTAARSSGPSESYAGRIRARVRPNIVFTEDVAGNPMAEVEVRMAPDGTITSRKIVKSSGARSWDEAVLRALDKTEVLPRDVDGRVHTPLIIEFKPKG